MPTVVTITFNPCVDTSISVPELIPEKKLACSAPKQDPGGGGINVARAFRRLGGSSIAIYPSGGYHGHLLTEMLVKEEVSAVPLHIEKETRENWVVYENATGKQYRFVMPGPALTEEEWKECITNLESVPDPQFIVISGSIQESVPEKAFECIAQIAKQKNAKLILDTSGAALKQALKYGAYLIKPNLNELASLIVALGLSDQSIATAARGIITRGYCEVVVVSLGPAGALIVCPDWEKEIKAPPAPKRSTVGAGDSMVAGIVFGLANGKSLEEAIKYGVACGTAATMNPGTELFHPQDVEQLYLRMQEETNS